MGSTTAFFSTVAIIEIAGFEFEFEFESLSMGDLGVSVPAATGLAMAASGWASMSMGCIKNN